MASHNLALGRLIGYARVSTPDQDLALQLNALRDAGCGLVFEDVASGSRSARPGLDTALASLACGDCLVVWRLDRLGRSSAHLVGLVQDLAGQGIGFRSLSESVNTTTASGKLVLSLFAAMAQFERDLLIERTRAGMAAAKARGAMVGRKPALTPAQLAHANKLVEAGESPTTVARSLGCGRSTLYRALARKSVRPGAGTPGRA